MIDQSLITPFAVPSLAGMGGLAQLTVPSGQLTVPSDVTQWGLGQWAAVIGIGYVAVSLFFDVKSAGSHVGKKTKKVKGKVKKAAVSGTSKIGTIVTVGALAAAGYVGYEIYQSSQSGGSQ